jgi:hypothetical protein
MELGFGYVILIAFAGLFLRYFWQNRIRSRHIQEFARDARLTYIGPALPKSFPCT